MYVIVLIDDQTMDVAGRVCSRILTAGGCFNLRSPLFTNQRILHPVVAAAFGLTLAAALENEYQNASRMYTRKGEIKSYYI